MKWILVLMIMMMGCASRPREFRYVSSPLVGSSPIEYRVYLDKNFGEMDKLSINDGIMQWNYAMNGYVKIEVVNSEFDMEPDILMGLGARDWLILKIDSDNRLVGDDVTLAFVNRIGGNKIWVIRDRISNQWVTGIIMHEIGHLMGIRHDNVYLMRERYSWENFRCVDYGSAKLAGDVYGLDIKQLNYCIYY